MSGRVSIIVPAYKEVENLPILVPRICAAAGKGPFEIIVVDDNSADGTKEQVAKLAAAGMPVKVITRVGERGLSSAVIRGFREASGDVLVCMDADLSHPPETVPKMVELIRTGEADFVVGSRYAPGGGTEEDWGFFRRINSKVATLLAFPFTRLRDPMSGFFALPRAAFLQAAGALNPVGYKIGLELLVKCRCSRVVEVPIRFANRHLGKSKLTLREQLNYLKHLKRLADFRFGKLSHLLQFCAVGATGMCVDLVCYAVLMTRIP